MKRSHDETERRNPGILALAADGLRLCGAISDAAAAGTRRRWADTRDAFPEVGARRGYFPADRF